MPIVVEVRKTYKYRMHRSQQDRHLHDIINISGSIWNHLTALQKRSYRLFGKHINEGRMKKHVAKLRMRGSRFTHWRLVGSQAVQDICERHEAAYQRFFSRQGRLPRFRKVKQYTSFTLKQAGWKLGEDSHQRGSSNHPKWTGRITILGQEYKFLKHRPLRGEIKTVTLKRGKRLLFIDQWERTTGKCSGCGQHQKMALQDRTFCCELCGLSVDRDQNAARNILEAGHRLLLSQSGEVST